MRSQKSILVQDVEALENLLSTPQNPVGYVEAQVSILA